MPTRSSGIRNCRPNWMRRRPKFDSSKLNTSARKRKSSQPAIVRIGSMIQRSRRPRRRSEGSSLEVRQCFVEMTRTCQHAFRKSMFRTTPKSVLAVVCRWRDWGSMKTARYLRIATCFAPNFMLRCSAHTFGESLLTFKPNPSKPNPFRPHAVQTSMRQSLAGFFCERNLVRVFFILIPWDSSDGSINERSCRIPLDDFSAIVDRRQHRLKY